MSQTAPAITRSPADVVRMTPVSQAANGVCYAAAGESSISSFDLERMIAAVPGKIASSLKRKAYYFVPLTVTQGEDILIADRYDVAQRQRGVPSQPESRRLAVRFHLHAAERRQIFRGL
jgi:hypothetical protein